MKRKKSVEENKNKKVKENEKEIDKTKKKKFLEDLLEDSDSDDEEFKPNENVSSDEETDPTQETEEDHTTPKETWNGQTYGDIQYDSFKLKKHLMKEELFKMGYRFSENKEGYIKTSFAENYNAGPKNIEEFENAPELFRSVLKPPVDHIINQSNTYFEENNIVSKKNCEIIYQWNHKKYEERIFNYIFILLFRGLQRVNNVKDFWDKKSKHYSSFVSSLLTYTMYKKINRFVHINVQTLVDYFNTWSKNSWTPGIVK
jgi:hypothetical protein